ncbi:hypothetical protein AK812_SmicGene5527 [Symbiodinium microadriaticum]|uniref:Uncharacterized protein n=1 Tax=Symbiodinium microadriaticum TaxID=2951 RepID=A0A1Q9ETG6_SYMMI|nr:hypothetical protein AK812_SmicGene5527 [Symbiodinium microadriaticum]
MVDSICLAKQADLEAVAFSGTGRRLVVRECESGSSYSHWCGVVQNISLGCRAQFGGLVADALVGLGATCSDGLANETIIQEAAARVQRAAGVADEQAWLEEDSFATFQVSMPLAQQLTLVCNSWQSLVADVTSSAPCTVGLDAGICATTEEVRFNHDMVNFASVCTFSACRNAVPEWMATPFEENLDFDWYCNCMQCRPFWMENFCSTLTVGIAVLTQMRESDIFGYNSLSWLMIIILTLIALTPLLVLLIHLSWWCWIGWPWAVPRDMDLEQKIERAAAQIQEELELQGSIKSTWWERLSMRWEFWQYVLDFGSDVFLIVQFLQYYHYIFAAMQASIVLLTAREELCTLGLRRLYRALRESLQYGLKTDDFLRLGQSERTIEGPLSLMLLAYTSFYMSTDTWAYLTALFSMIMSTSSVAKGPTGVSNEESRRSQDGEVAEVSTVPSASPEETGAVALGGWSEVHHLVNTLYKAGIILGWEIPKVNDWLRPQLFGRTYIFNPPRWLSMAHRVAGGFMSRKSLEKVWVHPGRVNAATGAEKGLCPFARELLGGAEALPSFLGGSANAEAFPAGPRARRAVPRRSLPILAGLPSPRPLQDEPSERSRKEEAESARDLQRDASCEGFQSVAGSKQGSQLPVSLSMCSAVTAREFAEEPAEAVPSFCRRAYGFFFCGSAIIDRRSRLILMFEHAGFTVLSSAIESYRLLLHWLEGVLLATSAPRRGLTSFDPLADPRPKPDCDQRPFELWAKILGEGGLGVA